MTGYGRKLSPSSNIATVLSELRFHKLRSSIKAGRKFDKSWLEIPRFWINCRCVNGISKKIGTKNISQG